MDLKAEARLLGLLLFFLGFLHDIEAIEGVADKSAHGTEGFAGLEHGGGDFLVGSLEVFLVEAFLESSDAETDPWENIEQLYKIGDVVKGKVTKIIPFGAFVELSHKIDGLVHISQISKDRIDKVKDKLQLGQEIEAMVIKLDKNVRRIGLSIRALEEGFSEEDLKAADEEITAAMLKPGEALGTMGALIGNSLDGLDVMKEAREEGEKAE